MVLSGYCSIAFRRRIGFVLWINAGTIGMPQHDGTQSTRFASVTSAGVHIETLSYDFNAAAAEMTKSGLVQGYEIALKTGIWPSQDVMPKEMRR